MFKNKQLVLLYNISLACSQASCVSLSARWLV